MSSFLTSLKSNIPLLKHAFCIYVCVHINPSSIKININLMSLRPHLSLSNVMSSHFSACSKDSVFCTVLFQICRTHFGDSQDKSHTQLEFHNFHECFCFAGRLNVLQENVRASKLADTLTAVEDKLADQEILQNFDQSKRSCDAVFAT